MSLKPLRLTIAVCVYGISLRASAQMPDQPTLGLLYNTAEVSSLVYRCERGANATLDCEFTQTAVRRKARPDELQAKLQAARTEFRTGFKISTEECNTYREIVAVLEGRKKAPKEDALRSLTSGERRDSLASVKVLVDLCTSRTEEGFLNLARVGHDKDTRTCKVSSNTYKQSFRLVQEISSSTGAWVAQGNPEGPCGVVQLSRFEPERLANSAYTLWKYVARKAITNPQGTLGPGIQCKVLDEGQHIYDWRSKVHSLGCEYIEFTPI